MIATIDIRVNAAHPNIPLSPLFAFEGSPSNVRILNVPQRVGKWEIDAVSVTIALPDNSSTTVPAVPVCGYWVATLPSCDETGYCASGFQITASGTDENGNAVTGYCLGVGDVTILSRDATAVSNGTRYYLHYVAEQPEHPNPGDMCYVDGVLKWYDGTAWQTFADGGASIDVVPPSTDPDDAGKAADAKATGDALAARPTKVQVEAGWWTEWTVTPSAPSGMFVVIRHDSAGVYYIWLSDTDEDPGRAPDAQVSSATDDKTELEFDIDGTSFTATRHRVAAPVPTKPEDIGAQPAGNYLTQHQQLTPVYSQTPTFSEWVCEPAGADGVPFEIVGDGSEGTYWMLVWGSSDYAQGYSDSTSLTWDAYGDRPAVTATRVRTDTIGYTLGDQTTKPLQPQGDYAPATNIPASALASAVQTSLGKADTAVQPAALTSKADSAALAPAYSASSAYSVGDVITHEGRRYVCNTAIAAGGEAWTAAHWTEESVQTAIGNIDVSSQVAGKLDSSSAAAPFSESSTYAVGEYVTYNGGLYVCSTAVTTAGAWTGSTNWTAKDMTTPDATLDILPDGTLRVASPSGTLWRQGYDLASESASVLLGNHVNYYAFAAPFSAETDYAKDDRVTYDGKPYKFKAAHLAGAWVGTDADEETFAMPTAATGKVGDFGLDIDNSANAVEIEVTLTGVDDTFSVVVPKGQSLVDMLTFAGGELAVLYFTLTAFRVNNLPTWQVLKQVVENGGAVSS